jgi:DNA-binding transcriptional ArsR family regulator
MADLFAMLSDPTRLRLLMFMEQQGEVCVTDLAREAGISESAVSHALRLLRAHGIVEASRDGRWMFYGLADEHVRVLLRATVEHLEHDHG